LFSEVKSEKLVDPSNNQIDMHLIQFLKNNLALLCLIAQRIRLLLSTCTSMK